VVIGEWPPLGDRELPYARLLGCCARSLVSVESPGSSNSPTRLATSWVRLAPELARTTVEIANRSPTEGSQARLFQQLLAALVKAAPQAPWSS
jgi:hypothetical protein